MIPSTAVPHNQINPPTPEWVRRLQDGPVQEGETDRILNVNDHIKGRLRQLGEFGDI